MPFPEASVSVQDIPYQPRLRTGSFALGREDIDAFLDDWDHSYGARSIVAEMPNDRPLVVIETTATREMAEALRYAPRPAYKAIDVRFADREEYQSRLVYGNAGNLVGQGRRGLLR